MTQFLLVLMGVAGLVISLLTAGLLALMARNSDLLRQLQEAEMWADEYQRQADEARREYAKILWLHDNTVVPTLSQAWRAALRK